MLTPLLTPLAAQRTNQSHPVRTSSQATAPVGPSYLFTSRFVSAPQAAVGSRCMHALLAEMPAS